MFSQTFKSIVIGGKIAALGALLGTTAMAQTTTTTDTVVVPEAAVEESSPIGVTGENAPRTIEQMDNDEAIAETLVAQGFEDIYILREGPIMTVTAQRLGEEVELVYSVANGTLVSINGEEIEDGQGDDSRSVGDVPEPMDTDTEEDSGEDEGADDDSGDNAGDDAGADDSGTEGEESEGSDAGESGSDAAGDTDAGESDGGENDGGDSDSEGGDSDGGEGGTNG